MGGARGFAAVAYLQRRTRAERAKAGAPLPSPGGGGPDSLEAGAAAWLESLQMRRYAAATVSDRGFALRVFVAWAAERDLLKTADITRPILEAYQRWMWRFEAPPTKPGGTPRRLSWHAQASRLATLKQWFQWLTRQNLILHNPASELELPRPEKRLPKNVLAASEVAQLLAVPDIADPLGLRDRAMLEVFYSTGLRRSELARVAADDVQLERGTLTVRQGKGRKDRVVPLGARAAAWVERYRHEVRPRLCLDPRVRELFLSAYGEAFNPDVISRMVTASLSAAGLAHKGSCHLLRHTCATHMLEGGADIRFVQQLLGHANIETTAIYTHVAINQLLDVHARCHPGARLESPPTPQTTPPPTASAPPPAAR